MQKNPTWILVADASRAFVYATDPTLTTRAREIQRFDHPQSRLRNQDLTSDAPGQRKPRRVGAQQRSFVDQGEEQKDREARRFAGELMDWLLAAWQRASFEQLVIAGPPHFLGYLRDACDDGLKPAIRLEIDKDLTQTPPHEVHDVVRGELETKV